MDRSISPGAGLLLDFISKDESHGDYRAIFGFKQSRLRKPVTSMTVDEILGGSAIVDRRSSAEGRYQIINKTLRGLKKSEGLSGSELMTPDLQDRLGMALLKRRGWERFRKGQIGVVAFGKALAQEWASLPVLAPCQGAKREVARGQSYYAGDGLNSARWKPEQVEAVLAKALQAEGRQPTPEAVAAEPAAPRRRTISPAPIATDEGPRPSFWQRILARLGLRPPAPPAAPIARLARPDPRVRAVQERLVALGYTGVGLADGRMGPRTEGAIKAFQGRAGLNPTGLVSDELVAALGRADPLPVAPERAGATLDTLRQLDAKPVKQADTVKRAATGFSLLSLLGVGGLGESGALDSLSAALDQVSGTLGSLQIILAGVLGAVQWLFTHWWLVAGLFGLFVVWQLVKQGLQMVALWRNAFWVRPGPVGASALERMPLAPVRRRRQAAAGSKRGAGKAARKAA